MMREPVGLGLGLALGLALALALAELAGVAADLLLFAVAVGLAEPVLVDPAELVVGLGSGFVTGADAVGAVARGQRGRQLGRPLEAGSAGDVVGGVGPWLVHVLAWTK